MLVDIAMKNMLTKVHFRASGFYLRKALCDKEKRMLSSYWAEYKLSK